MLVFCYAIFSYSQIPVIDSNVSDDFKGTSLLFKKLRHKYDFSIAYHVEGMFNFKNAKIQIIASKNNRWWKLTFIDKEKSCLKKRVKRKPLNEKIGKELVATLNQEGFWTLNNDSINNREVKPKPPVERKQSKDTVYVTGHKSVRSVHVVDGGFYYLQMIHGNKMRIYKTDNPDIYFKHYPQFTQRGNFIKSRDAFISAFGTF